MLITQRRGSTNCVFISQNRKQVYFFSDKIQPALFKYSNNTLLITRCYTVAGKMKAKRNLKNNKTVLLEYRYSESVSRFPHDSAAVRTLRKIVPRLGLLGLKIFYELDSRWEQISRAGLEFYKFRRDFPKINRLRKALSKMVIISLIKNSRAKKIYLHDFNPYG